MGASYATPELLTREESIAITDACRLTRNHHGRTTEAYFDRCVALNRLLPPDRRPAIDVKSIIEAHDHGPCEACGRPRRDHHMFESKNGLVRQVRYNDEEAELNAETKPLDPTPIAAMVATVVTVVIATPASASPPSITRLNDDDDAAQLVVVYDSGRDDDEVSVSDAEIEAHSLINARASNLVQRRRARDDGAY